MHIVVMVTGSREWTNVSCIQNALNACEQPNAQMVLVQGGARGADRMASEIAERRGWRVVTLYPDWESYGRSAGIRRNADMVSRYGPHTAHFLAFSHNHSAGTEHTIHLISSNPKYLPRLQVHRS